MMSDVKQIIMVGLTGERVGVGPMPTGPDGDALNGALAAVCSAFNRCHGHLTAEEHQRSFAGLTPEAKRLLHEAFHP